MAYCAQSEHSTIRVWGIVYLHKVFQDLSSDKRNAPHFLCIVTVHGAGRRNVYIVSNYKNQLEFIERTQSILLDLKDKTIYENTLFLNCCMGLLVAPQQWDNDECYQIKDIANNQNWFVNPLEANPNDWKKGPSEDSVENLAYHFRNCLCHKLFEVLGDSETIKYLNIHDYKDPDHKKLSFSLKIRFEDFKNFVLKYSEEKWNLLKEINEYNHHEKRN